MAYPKNKNKKEVRPFRTLAEHTGDFPFSSSSYLLRQQVHAAAAGFTLSKSRWSEKRKGIHKIRRKNERVEKGKNREDRRGDWSAFGALADPVGGRIHQHVIRFGPRADTVAA
ncbi:MAG TPA: hypothetical protein VMW41_06910 [Candidatus Bathyarchaeia archaeon]|nr:hypothetical protein [Candidatus Bathyarchaeia archaeon]